MKKVKCHYRGERKPIMTHELLPGVKMVVPDKQTNRLVQAAIESARTGEHDDGPILVFTVEQEYNIATLDTCKEVII
jgi:nitrogen regulatory protein PII